MFDDLRTISLLDWLENDLLMIVDSCQLASSDASFRRYFRIKTPEGSFVVMDAPPDKENTEPFIRVAELLAQIKVNVPIIFQQNTVEGFLLLEDFGSQCFLDQLSLENATALYSSAFDALLLMQSQTSIEHFDLPAYNEALLQRELGIFEEWFLHECLDTPIPAEIWAHLSEVLINSALDQPRVCVHRDYHSRNLMFLTDDSPGIIDFQDAVIGPITYDLVSLLRDCYISWSPELIERWRNDYYQRLVGLDLIAVSPEQFKRWFDLMGLQRHLKAIGIFSRLHLRDGKSTYLNDIPRTLTYVLAVCADYPELSAFSDFLQEQVVPVHETFRQSHSL
ncbi:MAG: phosphotransferase [Methylococcales bacterium]|nr:phosphotransferase [Methylococcales bacterium]